MTGGYASLPTGIVSSLNDFTISAWVKATSLANWARIFDFGTGQNFNMFLTADAGGTNALRFSITQQSFNAEQQLNGPALALNTWTHVAVTLSGNSTTMYVNGVAVATNTAMTLHPTNLGITTQNYLGKSQYPDPAFNGSIDDFRIYSRALSAQEVLQLAAPSVVMGATASSQTSTSVMLSALGSDVTAGEASLTYTWATVGSPPSTPVFSANGTNAAKNTAATFTKAGTYTLQVTIANPATGVATTSSVNVTVSQVATSLVATPASNTVAAGATTQFTAAVADQFGNPMTGQTNITWSVASGGGSINAAGLYTAGNSAGNVTVRTTPSSGVPFNTTITVVAPLAWYKADASSGTTLTDSSGNSNNGTLTGTASFASGVSGNALSVAGGNANLPTGIVSGLNDFTISAWVRPTSLANWARIFDFGTGTTVNMFLTADAGGTNALRFAITTSGNGAEQQLNGPALTLNAWTHVAVTLSGNNATLYVNGTVATTNANMTIHPAALGNTTQNYLGKSQYPDPAYQGMIDDFRIYGTALSASQVLQLADPIVVNAAIAAVNPTSATSTPLSALGTDLTAGEPALTYTWSAVGTPPGAVAFSANNSNAAKNTAATFSHAGTYNIQVTIVNPLAGLTTTSVTSVIVNSVFTSIQITPATANINDSSNQTFVATALDQFGVALTTQPTFSWSASGGSISPTGTFTAPFGSGDFQVTATSGTIAASAPVHVSLLAGDLNGDGKLSAADISAMMVALTNLQGYKSLHSFSNANLTALADVNGDHAITNSDLQALISMVANAVLAGGGAGAGSFASGDSAVASINPSSSQANSTTIEEENGRTVQTSLPVETEGDRSSPSGGQQSIENQTSPSDPATPKPPQGKHSLLATLKAELHSKGRHANAKKLELLDSILAEI